MAPKKKTSDIYSAESIAKLALAEGARKLGEILDAAKKRRYGDTGLGYSEVKAEWAQTEQAVDALDEIFSAMDEKETFVDVLKNNSDVEVRVMQVGPDGRLTDVSNKINLKDIKPELVREVQTKDGKNVLIGRNPQSREAALKLLQEMLPSMTLSQAQGRQDRTPYSIRQMELALAESDKILEHWKK
jgi:hypothetical protein